MTLDPAVLRAVYDDQLRLRHEDPLPEGVRVEWDGPVLRFVGHDWGGQVVYRDLDGVAGTDLDALIARQRDYFADRGEKVEWKLHGHDEPVDLPNRLRAAGFELEEQETILVGRIAALAATQPVPPGGVRIREVTGARGPGPDRRHGGRGLGL